MPPPTELAWVFGYGSLMWNPGFAHDAFATARLEGWHRALCIYSWHYRGTSEAPGLVLGLAPGGECIGRAIGVARDREAAMLAYLDEREQTNYVYERHLLPARLASGEPIEAWAYVARTGHRQYAGDLPEDEVLRHVLQGVGIGGPCSDYVRNTVAHLLEMGIGDPRLEAVVRRLDATGPLSSG
jgi:cation transport protein ChaC